MATSGYARYEIDGRIEEILNSLAAKFGGCFTRCYEHDGRCVLAILIGQKYYYFMGNNEVAITIILRAEDYLTVMEVIGFAGGNGVFRLDYGHNKDIVHKVETYLRNQGFKVTRTYFAEIPEHSEHAHKHYPPTESLLPHQY